MSSKKKPTPTQRNYDDAIAQRESRKRRKRFIRVNESQNFDWFVDGRSIKTKMFLNNMEAHFVLWRDFRSKHPQ